MNRGRIDVRQCRSYGSNGGEWGIAGESAEVTDKGK